MADKPKQPASREASASLEDSFLKDLDASNVAALEENGLENGRPLPKKVELDIDDLMFGEDEDEAEETEEPAEAGEQETVEEAPPPSEEPPRRVKYDVKKLTVLASAGLLGIGLLIGVGLWLRPTEGPPPPVRNVQPAARAIALEPFIINFPTPQGADVIITLTVSLVLSPGASPSQVASQTTVLRDMIFRYVQGQGPFDPSDQPTKERLGQELGGLIRNHIKAGVVERVEITNLAVV